MNAPREFMSRVVQWPGDEPGYINIHTTRVDKKDPNTGREPMFGKPFRDLNELMGYVQSCAANPGRHSAVFYCTSTQAQISSKGNFPIALRNKPNAKWLKAIWLDVDIGKKDSYATLNEALDAVNAFKLATALPSPTALVATGGGLHVYWISDKRLTQPEWQGYADGLKEEAKKFKLKADLQCTADAARILRVPGTFNTKYGQPRPVKVLHLSPEDLDFATALAHIRREVTAPVTRPGTPPTQFDLTGWKPLAAFSGLGDSLAEGINRYENLPLDPRPMFTQCQHFRGTLKTGGKNDPEPLWMLNLLATTFMENGEAIAHKLSDKYPTYTPQATEEKYEQRLKYKAEKNLGWPSCANFEGAGAKCQGCPLRGTIRSPLNLCVAKPAPPSTPAVAPSQNLPENYVLVNGIVCEVVQKRLHGGEVIEENWPLFMSKMRNFDIKRVGEKEVEFQMDVNIDMDNWQRRSILETYMSGEQKLMGALRENGIKPFSKNKGRIEQFMTSFMAKLDAEQYRTHAVPFGWLHSPKGGEVPVGFAYNRKIYMSDGTTQDAGASDGTFGPLYEPKGDVQSLVWYKLLKMITDQHHPALEALVAVSFAAPLLIGSGLYNAVVCGWSPEAGAHKSTSLHLGAAVWGEPKRTKEKPNATQKGIMKKAGEIKNLPIYWDEISDDKRLNIVRTMIGEMTEGGIGTRLKSDRTAFAYDDWQTLLTVAANKSLISNILQHVRDTDAQLQRLFEFQVEKRADTARPHDIALLCNSLDHNYGYVGEAYAKVLGSNPKAVMDFVKDVIDKFVLEVSCTSEARFRSAVAAVLWAGAALANHNLHCTFNLDELWEFLKDEFIRANDVIAKAEVVAGQRANTINAMTQFFKAMTRNTLWVQSKPTIHGKGRPWAVVQRAGPNPLRPDPIHVRCAETNAVIDISKHKLLSFFHDNEMNGAAVLLALRHHFGAKEVPRIDLSYGSGVAGGRETVVSIPVNSNSPFTAVVYKHCPPEELPPGMGVEEENGGPNVAPATNGTGEAVAAASEPLPEQGVEEVAAQGEPAAGPSVLGVGESVEAADAASITAPVTASENTAPPSGPTEPAATKGDSQPE